MYTKSLLAGLDLTTIIFSDGDDATRPRLQDLFVSLLLELLLKPDPDQHIDVYAEI
jgi:hypothetical protein